MTMKKKKKINNKKKQLYWWFKLDLSRGLRYRERSSKMGPRVIADVILLNSAMPPYDKPSQKESVAQHKEPRKRCCHKDYSVHT